jgi:hypothetical protein
MKLWFIHSQTRVIIGFQLDDAVEGVGSHNNSDILMQSIERKKHLQIPFFFFQYMIHGYFSIMYVMRGGGEM